VIDGDPNICHHCYWVNCIFIVYRKPASGQKWLFLY